MGNRITLIILMQWAIAGTALAADPAQAPYGTRSPYPAIVVPQIVIPHTAPPAVVLPQAPVDIQRPPTVTACDPGGCWNSDGTRLNRTGPEVIGPRGPCTTQNGVTTCP